MKVLLIQPSYRIARETYFWGCNPPLGLAYIAAVLENEDVNVEILDANALNLTPEQTAEKANEYDIIGISFLTPAHNFGIKTIRLLPNNILKVAGGPHASGYVEEMLKEGFDVVVRGEGEHTMLELVNEKNLKKIKGISYWRNGKIVHNESRPPEDINKLPFPARHLLPSNGINTPYLSAATQYTPWTPFVISRGCPFTCYFCNKKVFGQKLRYRSPENVVKELVYLKKEYKIKEIDIIDDSFNTNLDNANQILDAIIDMNLKLCIRFPNGMRVDNINEAFLDKLKKAGTEYIAYGIESGDQSVLDKIPKMVTIKQIKTAVKLTRKKGITTTGFIMFGLMGDTKESMQRTIDIAKELPLDYISFSITTPYPGTKLWDIVENEGKFLIKNSDGKIDWDRFHHTSSKMTFTHPHVASPEVVEEMYQKAYKEFYYRPTYILRKLLSIRSFSEFKALMRGAMALFKIKKATK